MWHNSQVFTKIQLSATANTRRKPWFWLAWRHVIRLLLLGNLRKRMPVLLQLKKCLQLQYIIISSSVTYHFPGITHIVGIFPNFTQFVDMPRQWRIHRDCNKLTAEREAKLATNNIHQLLKMANQLSTVFFFLL